ncbi:hypothetical protein KSP40_PGU022736 [Platanthera guangdongensis]|uniref:Uncharacterized protein n=1 Tax=Platanthera guangdongensis TaxID=2320717 RepID=A0ABR2ML04_9ASPA
MMRAIFSKKLPATAIKNGATVVSKNKDDSSDKQSDNSSDEEKGNGNKNVAAQKALLTLNNGVTQDSSSESLESYSDDEDYSAKVSHVKRKMHRVSSENYSDSDDEEMMRAIFSKKLPATAIKNGATVVSKNKDDSSDKQSDNSSDEEKGNGNKNVAAQKALLTLNNGVTQDSSSESSESYSDDEVNFSFLCLGVLIPFC